MSSFEQFCLYGGIAVGVIGLVMLLFGNKFLGLIAVIAGVGMVLNHFSKKKDIEKAKSLNSLSLSLVYRSFVHRFSFLIFYLDIP